MDNTPKTESIRNIVTNIKSGDIVLPEFQRDFVWDVGKTYDLFDSLVKDIFLGLLSNSRTVISKEGMPYIIEPIKISFTKESKRS